MRKLCFFITIFLIYISTDITYAKDDMLKIGITKYNTHSSIIINNGNLSFDIINDKEFSEDFSISSDNGFIFKAINKYTVKTNDSFDTYDDAKNNINKYEKEFILNDNNKYFIATNLFNNKQDANIFLDSNNINGEIVSLNNYICMYISNDIKMAIKDTVFIKDLDKNIVMLGDKKYRNIIQIKNKNNFLNIINILHMEEYLYGVVPNEMPATWEIEALKAQAISARNYAKLNKNIHKDNDFNLCDNAHCQVYGGVLSEQASTNKAVDDTKDIYAYYNDELINAVYFSSSGGYTANAENVWNEPVPYLKSIKDKFETGAKKWTRSFTFGELSNILNIDDISEIKLDISSENGRVLALTFIGGNKKEILEKEKIRTFFNKFDGGSGSLPSRNFKMLDSNNIYEKNNTEVFAISSKKTYPINFENMQILNNNNINTSNLFVADNLGNINSLAQIGYPYAQKNEPKTVTSLKREDNNLITFVGKGFGHGVGMSQYGANSLAKKGYTYDEILKYYYTGIDVR